MYFPITIVFSALEIRTHERKCHKISHTRGNDGKEKDHPGQLSLRVHLNVPACNSRIRPGAIEIQIQAKNFPYLETARLLEMPMAIDIHVLPRLLPRMDLYFDGTRVTRSFAAFGGSYAPVDNYYQKDNPSKGVLSIFLVIFCFVIGLCVRG
jgi:hypothetical protein